MSAVSTTSPNDAWIGGQNGQIWHYDGTDWTQHDSTGKWASAVPERIVELSPADVWMTASLGNVWHYDGTTWTQHDGTGKWDMGQMYGLDVRSASDVMVTGSDGKVWRGTGIEPLDFTDPANKSVVIQDMLPITDLSITGGSGSDELNLTLKASSGTIDFNTINAPSITGEGTDYVMMSGTREEINSTLATMHYTGSSLGQATITAELGNNVGDVIWNDGEGGNGHAYIVINENMTWQQAKDKAETYTFGGQQGYLATITDQVENDFVYEAIDEQTGWIGANDIADEGQWYWRTGPESGTQFWNGGPNGSPVGGQYSNWEPGEEPNNSDGNENCGQFWNEGYWNDIPCDTTRPFVVEFGGNTPGTLPQPLRSEFTVDVTPKLHNLSFDTQGGSSVASMNDLAEDSNVNLPAAPTRSGYIFQNWNTEADSSGDDYAAGDSFTVPTSNTTLYAIWKQDGNGDVIPDDSQPNVMNFTDPTTNKNVTLVVDPSCDISDSTGITNASNFATQDKNWHYSTGFVNFAVTGCDNNQTEVKIYYHGISPNGLTVRKYNPNTNTYFTVTDASMSALSSPLSGTLVSYIITDNGALDIDPAAGVIRDPVGLGVQVSSNGVIQGVDGLNAPNSGLPQINPWTRILAGFIGIVLTLVTYLGYKRTHATAKR